MPAIGEHGAQPVAPIRGELEVRGLTFGYEPERPVLHDVSLHVPAGATVAIVGATGSGKSTLASLLPRLFDPPPGTVFVDGVDVRLLPLAQLREAIGFVPQETFLFSATVRENVAFGLAPSVPPSEVAATRGGGGGGRPAGEGRGRFPARIRHARGRARPHPLRRTEAAHGAGARPGRRSAHPGARRRALRGRHLHGGGGAARPARRAAGRAPPCSCPTGSRP